MESRAECCYALQSTRFGRHAVHQSSTSLATAAQRRHGKHTSGSKEVARACAPPPLVPCPFPSSPCPFPPSPLSFCRGGTVASSRSLLLPCTQEHQKRQTHPTVAHQRCGCRMRSPIFALSGASVEESVHDPSPSLRSNARVLGRCSRRMAGWARAEPAHGTTIHKRQADAQDTSRPQAGCSIFPQHKPTL